MQQGIISNLLQGIFSTVAKLIVFIVIINVLMFKMTNICNYHRHT